MNDKQEKEQEQQREAIARLTGQYNTLKHTFDDLFEKVLRLERLRVFPSVAAKIEADDVKKILGDSIERFDKRLVRFNEQLDDLDERTVEHPKKIEKLIEGLAELRTRFDRCHSPDGRHHDWLG